VVSEQQVWQAIAGIFGTALVAILGWSLHGLVSGVQNQIATLQAGIEGRFSGLSDRIGDLVQRVSAVETRLIAIDGSLGAIQKDLGGLTAPQAPPKQDG
jgi:hypothetical protein